MSNQPNEYTLMRIKKKKRVISTALIAKQHIRISERLNWEGLSIPQPQQLRKSAVFVAKHTRRGLCYRATQIDHIPLSCSVSATSTAQQQQKMSAFI